MGMASGVIVALVIEAPNMFTSGLGQTSVFLAGSIEMGQAENWRQKIIDKLQKDKREAYTIIYNPRRSDWDASLAQTIENAQFRTQVEWELHYLLEADVALFYFDPQTKSPITLMELGLCAAKKPSKTFVCCPDGYHRKGNVDILCHKFGVQTVFKLDDLAEFRCVLDIW